MAYRIIFAPEALEDFRNLRAYIRAAVRDAIKRHLQHQPTHLGKSLIKRLRDIEKPQYRLRVGDIRVFYDVRGSEVEILAIIEKRHAADWLEKWGRKS